MSLLTLAQGETSVARVVTIVRQAVQYLNQLSFSNLLGSVSLTTQVSGVLPVANGGTAVGTGSFVHNGAWTPTDQSGATLTFANIHVAYSQEGNMVFVYGRLDYPVTGSGASATIGSLPVAVPNDLKAQLVNSSFTSAGLTFPITALTFKNTSTFGIFNDLTGGPVTNAQLSGATLQFNIIYPAA